MTRDEVIRMALEVGGIDKPEPDSPGVVFLERFAAMVAEAEGDKHNTGTHTCSDRCQRYACVAVREAVAAERERAQQIVTGMKTELQTLLEKTYLEGAIAAVKAEREACAKVCEDISAKNPFVWGIVECVARIRARGEA